MGVFLRVFDPKGFRHPYKRTEWRDVRRDRLEPLDSTRHHHIRDELHAEEAESRPPAQTQARVTPPEPGEEQEEDDTPPDPQENTLRKAKQPSSLERQYTDKREFYGPGELTGIASDFMKKDIPTVNMDTLVSAAAQQFKKLSVTHLPVVSAERHICGLITEHQLYKGLIDGTFNKKELNEKKVSEVMESPVLCCLMETPVKDVLETFINEGIGILPVVDTNDKLKGIVDKRELLKYFHDSVHFFGK